MIYSGRLERDTQKTVKPKRTTFPIDSEWKSSQLGQLSPGALIFLLPLSQSDSAEEQFS